MSDALDQAVSAMDTSFTARNMGDLSHAFGYSGARDPDFRYCVQSLRDAGSGYDGYVLDGCGLTGGCSGGPQVCFSCEMLSTVYIYKSLKDCII